MMRRFACMLALGWAALASAGAQSLAPGSSGPVALPLRAQVIDPAIQIGYGLAIADVDGDGREDILLADAREIAWYRNPTWTKSVIARQLTPKDHVCIAARDIDGDGRAEIAVGAEWNPGDTVGSGAIFYLERPADPALPWRPVRLPHEPTTHRMHWVKSARGEPLLAVLPLHGRGNQGGEGAGIRFLGYTRPARIDDPWPTVELDGALHLAHNFDPSETDASLLVAAKEGVHRLSPQGGTWVSQRLTPSPAGEVRSGRAADGSRFLATIEPMHGHQVAVYPREGAGGRVSLDENLIQGHGLATGDVLGLGHDQVVAGWRGAGPGSRVGIRLYSARDPGAASWALHGVVDDNTLACEDLKLADLDRDGDLDLIASGRATKNVVIYWNERLTAAAGAAGAATAAAVTPSPAPRDIFLLLGQSNMAGRGTVEAQDQIPHPRIFMLTAANAWVPAVDPMHFDKPQIAGVGLGSTFARKVAEVEPASILGLVPAAVGGTSLDQWMPDGELYRQAVARARFALGQGGRLRAILWHQGEADSKPEKAATYAARFERMITRLRADLGAENVPVLVGELLHARTASAAINPVLRNLPNSIARCVSVSAEGLTDQGDTLHFNSASLREFGLRYARAFLALPAGPASISAAP